MVWKQLRDSMEIQPLSPIQKQKFKEVDSFLKKHRVKIAREWEEDKKRKFIWRVESNPSKPDFESY
jgi:hypothetical protein